MRLPHPPSPDFIHPRPMRGAEVVAGFKDEEDDGVEFDPRRDISKKDWERMKGELEEYRGDDNEEMTGGEWWTFGSVAKDLLILFPDRRAELNLDQEAFDGMKKIIEEDRGNNSWWDFGGDAADLVDIFPDRKKELDLTVEIFETMERELWKSRNEHWPVFCYTAVRLVVLFPERRKELNLDVECFNEINNELQKLRDKNWEEFSAVAASLMLLFPDRKDDIKLDEKAFQAMKSELDKNHIRGSWQSFIHIATNLFILAAERAEIVNGQIVITPKKPKLTREPKPLPVRSNIASAR